VKDNHNAREFASNASLEIWAEKWGGDSPSFINFIVIFGLASKHISVLKNKRSRKWHDVVNKETRETIRRLYLNYLGAHSIAKELDLDVGVVMDIIRRSFDSKIMRFSEPNEIMSKTNCRKRWSSLYLLSIM
jgi:hypothetical protein